MYNVKKTTRPEIEKIVAMSRVPEFKAENVPLQRSPLQKHM